MPPDESKKSTLVFRRSRLIPLLQKRYFVVDLVLLVNVDIQVHKRPQLSIQCDHAYTVSRWRSERKKVVAHHCPEWAAVPRSECTAS
jgi:hypothetical protein